MFEWHPEEDGLQTVHQGRPRFVAQGLWDSLWVYCSYVNGILIFSKEPLELVKCLQITPLQGVGVPEYHLGGDFKIVKRTNSVETFTFCTKTYISNVYEWIEWLMGIVLKSYETPMATGDHPEIDDSGFLNSDEHSKYRMHIGCGQWPIKLHRGPI